MNYLMQNRSLRAVLPCVLVLSFFVFSGGDCQPMPNPVPVDTDGDGILDADDNCPNVANADQADTDGDGVADACEPDGIWRVTDGELLDFRAAVPTQYVQFSPNGAASFHQLQELTDFAFCLDMAHFELNPETLIISTGAVSGGGRQFSTLFAKFSRPDADTLEIEGFTGEGTATLTRVDAVPDSLLCNNLQVVNRVAMNPYPNFYGGELIADGDKLRIAVYETGSRHSQIDPDTGAVSPPAIFDDMASGYYYPLDSQGTDFWLGSSSSEKKVQRRTPAGMLVDEVDTTLLGIPINIDSAAFDPVAKVLWVYGYQFEGNSNHNYLLKIDSEVEPDVLLDQFDMGLSNSRIRSLAADGESLWALSYGAGNDGFIQIDPENLSPIRSYSLPDPNVNFMSVAVLGSRIFLMSQDYYNNQIELFEVSP